VFPYGGGGARLMHAVGFVWWLAQGGAPISAAGWMVITMTVFAVKIKPLMGA